MADRYWVGGTGNWSDDDNHWAPSSGGTPADGNLPTSSDDVFIDANSGFGGGGTITINTTASFHDLTSNSGHSYTISNTDYWDFDCYGSLTLENTITLISTGVFYFGATSSGKTITTAGVDLGDIYFYGVNGGWTILDDFEASVDFYQDNGTFDANNYNVTANDFYFNAGTSKTPTIIMGSGTWEATGGDWYVEEYNGEVLTVNPETSTIKLTGGTGEFLGNIGKTYNNAWISGCSEGYILTSNTFNDLKIDAGTTVWFTEGTTQTVTTFTAIGTLGNLITLNSGDEATQFTLSKSSGIVSCDYLDISNSNATGGASWYAGANSADTTNNDGWIFTAPETVKMVPQRYW